MEKIEIQYYKTILGELIIGSFNDKLCLCDWKYRKVRDSVDDHRIKNFLKANYMEQSSPVIEKTIIQLEKYINKKKGKFQYSINSLWLGISKICLERINSNTLW